MRHRPPHFTHVFSGGYYASAYYSYMWSEVLDADAFAAFEETGDIFNPGSRRASSISNVLSAGGSRDPAELYLAFRGRMPSADALLKKRGFLDAAGMTELHTAGIAVAWLQRRMRQRPKPAAPILAEGGNALEAMVAMAASIAAVYPHMNHIGGDGFWLVHEPNGRVRAFMARGTCRIAGTARALPPARDDSAARTACRADRSGRDRGLDAGDGGREEHGRADAARCAAGRRDRPGPRRIYGHAEPGGADAEKLAELKDVPGFAATFLPDGKPPEAGDHAQQQPALAATLDHLAHAGLDDFYRGDVGREIAADLERIGSPVTRDDLGRYRAAVKEPLSVTLECRHDVQHAAADAGFGVADHPCAVRAAAGRRGRELRVRPRPGRVHQARLPRARPRTSPIRRNCRIRRSAILDPKFLDVEVEKIDRRKAAQLAGAPRAKATRSGWARPMPTGLWCRTSSRSTGSSARAACCRRPAC